MLSEAHHERDDSRSLNWSNAIGRPNQDHFQDSKRATVSQEGVWRCNLQPIQSEGRL